MHCIWKRTVGWLHYEQKIRKQASPLSARLSLHNYLALSLFTLHIHFLPNVAEKER